MKPGSRSATLFVPLGMLLLSPGLGGCTRAPDDVALPLGRPVIEALGVPARGPFSRLEIAARPPGVTAWNARLEKGLNGWRIFSRSDRPGDPGDLADSKLVDHFLEIVGTFSTEATAGAGNDSIFGLNPYRLEIRIDAPTGKTLQIGDPAGTNGVYFRVGSTGTVGVGRGALIAFLPTLETPDSLVAKSPFFAPLEEIASIRLEKLEGAARGTWEFDRADDGWRQGKSPLSADRNALLDRVFRQRLVRVLPAGESPELAHPDWRLTVFTARGEETLALAFNLDQVLGRNPARSDRRLELYPEFAGALRAFTQARFTPRRSGTK